MSGEATAARLELLRNLAATGSTAERALALLQIEIERQVNLERAEARERLREECSIYQVVGADGALSAKVVHRPTGHWAQRATTAEALDALEVLLTPSWELLEPTCGNLPPGGALQGLGVKCQLPAGHDERRPHRWSNSSGDGITWGGPEGGVMPYDA